MIHMIFFDQTGTELYVSGHIKTSIVLSFILKVGEHSDCHSICREDHLIPPLGQIADNIRLSPFGSSHLFTWHCRTKGYDLPLHRSHIVSIFWLCFNKLKMNVSCLSKAQRLHAEFVENFYVLSGKQRKLLSTFNTRNVYSVHIRYGMCLPVLTQVNTRWMDKCMIQIIEMSN